MWDQIVAEASKPANVVAFLKITLDKGLLAVVIAVLAFATTLIVERVKASLARQHEILKITAPAALKLIESCEGLYKAGMAALHEKAEAFAPFEKWADALLSAPVAPIKRMSFGDIPSGSEAQNATLQLRNGSIISVRDLLKTTAPSKDVISLCDSSIFWSLPSVTGADGSLIRHLYLSYMSNSSPDAMAASVQFQMARVFSEARLGRSKSYSFAVLRFRNEVHKTLYPGNKAQLRAIEGIHAVLDANLQAFETFPSLDIGRARILGSANATSAFECLANGHAHLIAFIGTHLRRC